MAIAITEVTEVWTTAPQQQHLLRNDDLYKFFLNIVSPLKV